jgi:hypothetical protein
MVLARFVPRISLKPSRHRCRYARGTVSRDADAARRQPPPVAPALTGAVGIAQASLVSIHRALEGVAMQRTWPRTWRRPIAIWIVLGAVATVATGVWWFRLRGDHAPAAPSTGGTDHGPSPADDPPTPATTTVIEFPRQSWGAAEIEMQPIERGVFAQSVEPARSPSMTTMWHTSFHSSREGSTRSRSNSATK